MEAYGCELSWRWATVTSMAVVLPRGYRGDESMIDGLRCYGGLYLYRLGGGWLHDRSNLVFIYYAGSVKPNLWERPLTYH